MAKVFTLSPGRESPKKSPRYGDRGRNPYELIVYFMYEIYTLVGLLLKYVSIKISRAYPNYVGTFQMCLFIMAKSCDHHGKSSFFSMISGQMNGIFAELR